MKRLIAGLTIAMSLSLPPYQAEAESRAVNGLLLGAGSGAIIGQAVGRNTKGTVVGTAIGSLLGYAIGNEMDREAVYRPVSRQAVYQRPQVVVVRPESQEVCRDTEILATIDGRPETLYGRSCWQDGEWVMVADQSLPPSLITRTVIIRERDHHRHGHRPQRRAWGRDDHDRRDHRQHRDWGRDNHGRRDHRESVIFRAGW